MINISANLSLNMLRDVIPVKKPISFKVKYKNTE